MERRRDDAAAPVELDVRQTYEIDGGAERQPVPARLRRRRVEVELRRRDRRRGRAVDRQPAARGEAAEAALLGARAEVDLANKTGCTTLNNAAKQGKDK
mgnify:CR=1 FL=1